MTKFEFWHLLVAVAALWLVYVVAYKLSNQTPPARPDSDGPRGVGGWLLILIVGLMVFGPLISLGQTATNLDQAERMYPSLLGNKNWMDYKTNTWITYAVGAAASIYAGYILASRRDPSAVTWAGLIIWLILPIVFFVQNFVLPGIYFNADVSDVIADSHLAGYLITTVIWTAYLYASKRVVNTYYPEGKQTLKSSTPNEPSDEQLQLVGKSQLATLHSKSTAQRSSGDRLNETHAELLNPLETTPYAIEIDQAEESAYATAMAEIETQQVRTGLWAKFWAEFDGDERLVTAKYLRTRAAEILSQRPEGQNTTGQVESGVEDEFLKEQEIHERELRTLLSQGQQIAAEKLQIKWALRSPEKKQACLELLEQWPNSTREMQPRIALLELLGGHVKWYSDQTPSFGGYLHFAGESRALSNGAKISDWIDDHLATAARGILKDDAT